MFPHLGKTKPEIKVAGFLKQKDQDVCVVPRGIAKRPRIISWGPLASEGIQDEFGDEYTRNTLIINVRSQMSSIAKNTDTLFERTFAEALNLHMMYPDAVLGEVYLIPVCEYDESTMDARRITFKQHNTNIAKYISFFGAINKRTSTTEDLYKYERCTLLIVDFRPEIPILYSSTSQLISAGLLPRDFPIEMSQLAFHSFADDILSVYAERFNIDTLK